MSFRSPFVLFLYMVQVSFKFTTFFIIALFPVLNTSCCFTEMLREVLILDLSLSLWLLSLSLTLSLSLLLLL